VAALIDTEISARRPTILHHAAARSSAKRRSERLA
jgi:hypothetical protein